MWRYEPPWRDMRFVIEELLELPAQWASLPGFEAVDAELARQVIDEAGRFAGEVLAPINAAGDLEGCTWQDGQVRTPTGYREAYAAFVQAGWPALACDVACGGQGLPQVLNSVLFEMLVAANHSWTMAPGLLHGAYECLHRHAAPELRERYLGKVVSGEWLATMCLTEAQAGSDLGRVATRAVPRGDGSFAISGQKIFISGGEHDLTDNIVHLVLARPNDPQHGPVPAGSRGLSLFVAPKSRPGRDVLDDELGARARGPAGPGPRRGGVAERAALCQRARAVARAGHARGERRADRRPPRDAAAAVVAARARRGRAHAGLRGLAPDRRGRARCRRVAPSSSPRCSRRWSRRCSRSTALPQPATRCRSGAGMATCTTSCIEQTLRDARIAMIYEGTNEIQAIDLLVRKGVADGGLGLAALYDWIETALAPCRRHGERVSGCLGALRRATRELVDGAAQDPELPYRAADDFMHALGVLLYAQGFARADAVAEHALAAGTTEPDFYAAKRAAADFFIERELPEFDRRLALLRAARRALAQPV